jgi:tetratricopeptide (TPR) repeat protein
VSKFLEQFKVLVTYNGKSFDQPLLETRYRMQRQRPPFTRLQHLDLLYGARRLWKLRFDSCRLVELENQILGIERQGDLPGEMIPYVYFEYLRTQEAHRVVPILHHNVMDIATLACLTSIVPWAFHSGEPAARFQHGAELLGLARWVRKAGEWEQASALFRKSIDRGLKDALLWPAMWDLAQAEKKLGRAEAAIAVFTDLAGCSNPFRVDAYEELAKYFEHRERNHVMALEMTQCAMKYGHTPTLKKREERLTKRASQPKSRRLGL